MKVVTVSGVNTACYVASTIYVFLTFKSACKS